MQRLLNETYSNVIITTYSIILYSYIFLHFLLINLMFKNVLKFNKYIGTNA